MSALQKKLSDLEGKLADLEAKLAQALRDSANYKQQFQVSRIHLYIWYFNLQPLQIVDLQNLLQDIAEQKWSALLALVSATQVYHRGWFLIGFQKIR